MDKRFENLERLASNNWEEILPEKPKAKPLPKRRPAPRTKMQVQKASSGLALAIAAARRRKKALTENNSEDIVISEGPARRTPRSARKSQGLPKRKSVTKSQVTHSARFVCFDAYIGF